MRHRSKRFKLGKPADQRRALIRSLLIALVSEEKIKTTYTRAKEVSRWADKLITLGKRGDIHSRRLAYRWLQDRDLVKKLFDDIAPRFKDVNGGYTRVIKVNNRKGDNALMAIIEFTKVKEEIIEEKKKRKLLRREKRKKQLQEEIPPEVEEVKVEEVKEEKKKTKKKTEPKPKKEEIKEEKEESKTEEEKEAKSKGFLSGLKDFLKRKKNP
jgi:large subunit ribosomal protein L17